MKNCEKERKIAMLIDQLPEKGKRFAFDYARLGKHFAAAVRFLETEDLSTLPVGKHEIDGENVFVLMQEYNQQEKEPSYEAHAVYADIQLILKGSERFRWGKGVLEPLDEAKDFRHAQVEEYVEFTLHEKQFTIFFPGEAHAPGLPENGPAFCRKAVIKVRA